MIWVKAKNKENKFYLGISIITQTKNELFKKSELEAVFGLFFQTPAIKKRLYF